MADNSTPAPDPDTDHLWVGAILLPLTAAQARLAANAKPVAVNLTVRPLETYCQHCRQDWSPDRAGAPCPAADGKAGKRGGVYLHGGPIGERRKRGSTRPPGPTGSTGPGRQTPARSA